MGWFWGDSNNDDPTKKLDPELRQYLEQVTPAKYTPTTTVQPSVESPKVAESKTHVPSTSSTPETAEASSPPVPSASLFPDGRYAYLWKGYKPLHELEGSELRTAERAIDKFKQRKDTVHLAALENCSLEHEALTFCFQRGDFWNMTRARATMCADENRTFSRCYTTQAKFLQALGYAASFDWDQDKEERIQMHADKLYHQMLDFERRVEEARAAGIEPPPITSLFNPDAKPIRQESEQNTQGEFIIPGGEQLPPGVKPSKPLEKLSPHERELEIRSIKKQIEQQKIYVDEAAPFMKSHEGARVKRQERAIRWFGETIGKWIT
ncbi:hypothetical protein Egran_03523 [Elaphomyces granulatus]|uniref:Uncharacterized protein n=1 Tax=Elaphomyces granulatus TaxID=519963 RepID=A0A232LXA4_9EURO|nr:hypothetical protein Egran_03523 [Elaphomyces granulatus]